jgi:HD superfamily phosphohydrolase
MGLAFLDFPTLTHTRLEHSVGVLHVADMIYLALRESDRLCPEDHAAVFGDAAWDDQLRQAVRLAALLHDLGHPAFSHAVELTFARYPNLIERAKKAAEGAEKELFDDYSHETFTRWLIQKLFTKDLKEDKVLWGLLSRLDEDIVKDIPNLAIGKATGHLRAFNPIISGDFDADRIDYLIRDNRRSGFAIGLSLEELHMAVHLRKPAKGLYELYIDASALPFVNSVLSARHRLVRRVHLASTGRTATQMLINCLYGILRTYGPAKLKDKIVWMHTDCTDFTFYQQLRFQQRSKTKSTGKKVKRWTSLDPIEGYFVDRFESVALRPSLNKVWKPYATLDFMHMHPCLCLLGHIAASGGWDSPRDLTFQNGEDILFVEPSTRTAQWSHLMVDYARDDPDGPKDRRGGHAAVEPSLDFVGTTENRVGRAILVQAMSNLDCFVYRLDEVVDKKKRAVLLPQDTSDLQRVDPASAEDYSSHLSDEQQKFAAAGLAKLGQRQRKDWPVKRKGMIAAEYVLLVLYALDDHVRWHWDDARDVYVHRSEYFVTRFLPSLARGRAGAEAKWFPDLFMDRRDPDAEINQHKVFSQIQRLAAFGLILTRANSAFHKERNPGSGATRSRVYSTREEIQINAWGKHYVESEMDPERNYPGLMDLLRRRQSRALSDLHQMAKWPADSAATASPEQAEQERHEFAIKIDTRGACAMTFYTSKEEPRKGERPLPPDPR